MAKISVDRLEAVEKTPSDIPFQERQPKKISPDRLQVGISAPAGSLSIEERQQNVRDFIQTAKEEALPLAGSLAGSFAKKAPVAAALSGAGAAAGEAGAQIFQIGDAPEFGSPEGIKDIIERGAEGALGETAARGLTVVGGFLKKKISGLFAKLFGAKPIPGAIEAQTAIRAGGGEIPGSRLVETGPLPVSEKIAQQSFVGGSILKRQDIINRKVENKLVKNLAVDIGEAANTEFNRRDVGRLIVDTLDKGIAAHTAFSTAMFERLKVDASGELITTPVRAVNDIDDEIIGDILRNLGLTNDTATAAREFFQSDVSGTRSIFFDDAFEIKKALGAAERSLARTKESIRDNNDLRIVKSLSSQINNAISTSLEQASPVLHSQWVKANREVANRFAIFNNKLIETLMTSRDAPAKIADALFIDGKDDTIRRVYAGIHAAARRDKRIKPLEIIRKIRGEFANKIMQKASDSKGYNGTVLQSFFKSPKQSNTLVAALGAKSAANFKKIANEIAVAQTKPQEIGQFIGGAFRLSEVGGLPVLTIGLSRNDPLMITMGSIMTITPGILGKIVTSETLTNLLVKGMAEVPSRKGLSTGGRFIRELIKAGVTIKEIQAVEEFKAGSSIPAQNTQPIIQQ